MLIDSSDEEEAAGTGGATNVLADTDSDYDAEADALAGLESDDETVRGGSDNDTSAGGLDIKPRRALTALPQNTVR